MRQFNSHEEKFHVSSGESVQIERIDGDNSARQLVFCGVRGRLSRASVSHFSAISAISASGNGIGALA